MLAIRRRRAQKSVPCAFLHDVSVSSTSPFSATRALFSVVDVHRMHGVPCDVLLAPHPSLRGSRPSPRPRPSLRDSRPPPRPSARAFPSPSPFPAARLPPPVSRTFRSLPSLPFPTCYRKQQETCEGPEGLQQRGAAPSLSPPSPSPPPSLSLSLSLSLVSSSFLGLDGPSGVDTWTRRRQTRRPAGAGLARGVAPGMGAAAAVPHGDVARAVLEAPAAGRGRPACHRRARPCPAASRQTPCIATRGPQARRRSWPVPATAAAHARRRPCCGCSGTSVR